MCHVSIIKLFTWLVSYRGLFGLQIHGLMQRKTAWGHQLSWTLSMSFIILSLLLSYVRVFPQRSLRWTFIGTGIFSVCWTLSNLLGLIFQCQPVSYFWNKDLEGSCFTNTPGFYFAEGLISAFIVLILFLLPIPIIWKLNLVRTKRIELVFSFSIGAV